MNAEQYRAVIGWFNARPAAKKALRLVSRSAVALVYLLYLGMLAWLAWHRMGTALARARRARVGVRVGTLVRKLIDRPRPYTALALRRFSPRTRPARACPAATAFRRRP